MSEINFKCNSLYCDENQDLIILYEKQNNKKLNKKNRKINLSELNISFTRLIEKLLNYCTTRFEINENDIDVESRYYPNILMFNSFDETTSGTYEIYQFISPNQTDELTSNIIKNLSLFCSCLFLRSEITMDIFGEKQHVFVKPEQLYRFQHKLEKNPIVLVNSNPSFKKTIHLPLLTQNSKIDPLDVNMGSKITW